LARAGARRVQRFRGHRTRGELHDVEDALSGVGVREQLERERLSFVDRLRLREVRADAERRRRGTVGAVAAPLELALHGAAIERLERHPEGLWALAPLHLDAVAEV